jgi:hypothetical protein
MAANGAPTVARALLYLNRTFRVAIRNQRIESTRVQ